MKTKARAVSELTVCAHRQCTLAVRRITTTGMGVLVSAKLTRVSLILAVAVGILAMLIGARVNADEGADIAEFQQQKLLMLNLINDARRDAGVPEVTLGDNQAAQAHAEDIGRHCTTGHWGTDGAKPYVRFEMAGGDKGGGWYPSEENTRGYAIRYLFDCGVFVGAQRALAIADIPKWGAEEVEYAFENLMGSPGHKAIMLKDSHNRVSLGMAWRETSTQQLLWVVMQFYNDYADCKFQMSQGATLKAECTTRDVYPSMTLGISVYFDEPPMPATRGQMASTGFARYGRQLGSFRTALTGDLRYTTKTFYTDVYERDCGGPHDYPRSQTIVDYIRIPCPLPQQKQLRWRDGERLIRDRTIIASFDLQPFFDANGPGVYTIFMWGCKRADSWNSPCGDTEVVPIMSKSIFQGFDFEPTPTPTPRPTPEPTPRPTPTPIPSPTPVPTATATPEPTPTGNVADESWCETPGVYYLMECD